MSDEQKQIEKEIVISFSQTVSKNIATLGVYFRYESDPQDEVRFRELSVLELILAADLINVAHKIQDRATKRSLYIKDYTGMKFKSEILKRK